MSELRKVKQDLSTTKDYQALLSDLISIVDKSKSHVYKVVDNIKVQTYWQIGERIVREEMNSKERAEYGKYIVDNLVFDLGFGRRILYDIIKFYRTYPIVHALHAQLSWYHYKALITIDNKEERDFYEKKSISSSWAYRTLETNIKENLFHRISKNEIEQILKISLPVVGTNEIFKDMYNFNPLQLPEKHREKDLEDKIFDNIILFLQELGEYFLLADRQAPIKIDNQTHFIDIVLYNRSIPCIILVDLKAGKLDSRDIGQMNKYVEYYRKNRQFEHEKDTIGLIICQDAGKEEIQYALGGLEEKIFVSTYKSKLPDEERIKKVLKDI